MSKKRIKFTELLVNPTPFDYNFKPFVPRRNTQITFEQEDPKTLTLTPDQPKTMSEKKVEYDTKQYVPIEVVNWEKDIDYYLNILDNKPVPVDPIRQDLQLKLFFEDILNEKWENNIHKKPGNITLLYQDPNLIFSNIEKKKKKTKKYNLSNDKYYAVKKQKKVENLTNIGVQHSVIALKLNPLFYKTYYTREELKNYHKKYISITGLDIQFVDKPKVKHSFIKHVEELTIADGCDFCLIEYCEEHPLYVNNSGMVSVIENYKREGKKEINIKQGARDKGIENPETLFNTVKLSLSDPSPFPIADIAPGKKTLAISNNLFKAPLYHQDIDLFVVSFRTSDPQNSVIRPVKVFLTAGQVFPLQEVFAPHSKSLNIYCKNRLKMTAFSFQNRVIKMKDLDEMFPTFSEGSKRKWLKEYAEKKKDNTYVLNYRTDELLVTPENTCQYESMLLGEKLLKDEVIDNELTPWSLSKNFLKGNFYDVVGRGDPTGFGFSFVRGIKDDFKELVSSRWDLQEKCLTSQLSIETLKEEEIDSLVDYLFEQSEECGECVTQKQEEVFDTGIKIIRVIDGETEEEIVTDKEIIKEYLNERKKLKKEDKRVALKCGNCGQVGHMKTNKACPNFVEEEKMNKKKKEAYKRKVKGTICESILAVINTLSNLPYSVAFHRPVNTKKFPNYLEFVKEPIDLSTMRNKARHNKYVKYYDFLKDLELMRDNCVAYNGNEHSFTKVASEMVEIATQEYKTKKEELEYAENVLKDID